MQTHTYMGKLATAALSSVWRIGIYESQIAVITKGSSSACFFKIHRHKHKGRMEEDRGSPTDGDKHKNPERGGGRLIESNTEINTNEWLLSQPEKAISRL